MPVFPLNIVYIIYLNYQRYIGLIWTKLGNSVCQILISQTIYHAVFRFWLKFEYCKSSALFLPRDHNGTVYQL